ncbi:MAG: hypothetical protein E5Y10_18805 [Mesorhizobium sp.]|nr:MAG: hypothetical protein EOS13_19890 [Mesorhizobium sp.]TIN26583.1 MAG: hypothetical protein E5Y19_13115 [Mesorhizobium sp.]TIN36514.1 MAG: hypothetical protein E5Y13_23615 [Mesorhizobium sp.]TJU83166.1 MAG: hypothetical protein E5Y15_14265 [Mesorhizobium sp.]TJU87757.1 MAG: hypothetical protein E5Y10_18805 [Mesorhizobium sp.]
MKWTKRGSKWKAAVDVCMGLIEGERTPDDVRRPSRLLPRRRGCYAPPLIRLTSVGAIEHRMPQNQLRYLRASTT